jgi:hypothetical protein
MVDGIANFPDSDLMFGSSTKTEPDLKNPTHPSFQTHT